MLMFFVPGQKKMCQITVTVELLRLEWSKYEKYNSAKLNTIYYRSACVWGQGGWVGRLSAKIQRDAERKYRHNSI
jgi:hypothetical protein